MSTALFEGTGHAAAYAKYRPTYPKPVIDRIIHFIKTNSNVSHRFLMAVDVGCGSGQLTRDLTPHFKHIVGLDVSEAQLECARNSGMTQNIEYKYGSGESIPVQSESVDLITCAQAVHWFDYKKFCDEVDRILKPSGCLAILGYSSPHLRYTGEFEEGLRQLFDEFYKVTMLGYSSERIKLLNNKYTEITLPYDDCERDDRFEIRRDVKLSHLFDYLTSWSSYRAYIEKNADWPDPVQQLKQKMLSLVGPGLSADEIDITIVEPVFILLGRKPPVKS